MKKTLVLAAAAALLLPSIASATDLSGLWSLSAKVQDMPITIECHLAQAGAALTGTCGLAEGASPQDALTGTVEGTKANWAYDVDFNGDKTHVAYTADLVSDTAMTGSFTFQGAASPFTGTKK